MKKIILSLAIALSGNCSYAQFISGGGISTTMDNVGIGTTNFLQKFTIKSPGTLTGSSSTDYDFGITDGAAYQLQLLGLVNTSGQYGLLQVIKGGIGPGNLVLQTQGGNVRIGTTSPVNKLHVYSTSSADGIAIDGDNNPAVILRANGAVKGYASGVATNDGAFFNDASAGDMVYRSESNHILFGVGTGSYATLTVTGDKVGIGTTDPKGYKLSVNGSAIATSITVKLYDSWPDFVFKRNYKLPNLSEVKSYIEQNKHLPEMPSEQEVKDNGINLGEVVKIQTKKIEELTLYLIEKDRQLSEQSIKLKGQQKRISQLKKEDEARISALEKALSKMAINN